MRKKKHFDRILTWVSCLLTAFLVSCSFSNGDTTVVFTTGFGKDEIFRIGSTSLSKAEYMVYLTNTQNRYEKVYGPEIWELSVDGESLEENIKETVLAKLAQIKTMNLLAAEYGIVLSQTQQEDIAQRAGQYYRSLNETEKEQLQVSEETIRQMLTEYVMAKSVYEEIILTVNPEISDDEARIVTVELIFLKTYSSDADGRRMDYTQSMKNNCREKLTKLRMQAEEGTASFRELAREYSDLEEIEAAFGIEEENEVLRQAVFSLGKDEISKVLETEDGFYLIKCINTYNQEETDANKIRLMEKRRNEAFGNTYDAFVETLTRKLNEDLWKEITLIHDENVKTSTFFEYCDF